MIQRIRVILRRLIRFLTYDIWRYTVGDKSSKRMNLYNVLKAFILASRNIDSSELNTRAAALTYKTLLAIVPLLAVLFAIARGFGLQDIVVNELMNYFAGQADVIQRSMTFVNQSLEYAKGGLFLGIGVVLLLYTVINLLSSIEDNFNTIWQIKNGRTYYRQFTDYLALIIIAPVFLVCNAGFTFLLTSTGEMYELIGVVVSPMLKVVPFVLTILLFTLFYIYIPNTKVKFSAALIAGAFTGTAFQVFQMLYIHGQIWISKYNAIYGSFAVLPLLLLWMQLSWFILLFGVKLAFAYQNVYKFSFEHETKNISRRYKDFVLLIVISLIAKRFEKGDKPYTTDEISSTHKIPTKLTSDIIYYLLDLGVIVETPSDDVRVSAYIPAIDINQLSVGYVFTKMNMYGSEDFVIDVENTFRNEWEQILKLDAMVLDIGSDVLIKDLQTDSTSN